MDKSAEKIYKTVITYGGGPKPSEGKIIPGVYCPAQRKPSDGEKSEPIWIIAGHGG